MAVFRSRWKLASVALAIGLLASPLTFDPSLGASLRGFGNGNGADSGNSERFNLDQDPCSFGRGGRQGGGNRGDFACGQRGGRQHNNGNGNGNAQRPGSNAFGLQFDNSGDY